VAFSVGHFVARLGIDTGEYSRGILNAQTTTAVFGQTFVNFVTNPLLGAVGLMKDFAGGTGRAAKEMLSWVEVLDLVSKQTGITRETIQTLRESIAFAGGEAGTADQALTFFANRLGEIRSGTQPIPPALASISEELRNVANADDGLRLVLETISRMEDPTLRTALAADLLGRQAGPALIAAIGGGTRALEDQTKQFRDLGKILRDDTLNELARAAGIFDEVTFAIDGMKRTALSSFLTGFSRETNIAAGDITREMQRVTQEVESSFNKMGESASRLVGGLDGIVSKLELIADLASSVSEAIDFGQNLGGAITAGFVGGEGNFTEGRFIRQVVRPVQRLRRRANR